MGVRIISSVVGLPVLIFFVGYGGIPLQTVILLASLIGMHEFYQAFSLKSKGVQYISYFFAVVYMIFIDDIINMQNMFNVFTSLYLLILLIYTVLFHQKTNAEEGMLGFFGFFYVVFLLSHVFLIRSYPYGNMFVWLAFISAWGCDTGAYFTGVTIGKHKLIPTLSPKKTIEGSIGGIITATILALLYGWFIEKNFPLEEVNVFLLCGLTGVFGSILSQIGDLAASAMKRYTGIKDFGKLIPGHGGILDRFDSVLLTAPVVYYIMMFLIQVSR